MLFKVFFYLVLSQSYSYLNLTELDTIFLNFIPSFLVAKNTDRCFSARKICCRVLARHCEDVDSHCSLKSKMKILCQVYLHRCNNWLHVTSKICCLPQRAKFDFNQEYPQKYEEKHDTNTFSKRAFYNQ